MTGTSPVKMGPRAPMKASMERTHLNRAPLHLWFRIQGMWYAGILTLSRDIPAGSSKPQRQYSVM